MSAALARRDHGLNPTPERLPLNDLRTVDGHLLRSPVSEQQLYRDYADGQRVQQSVSLFDYRPGETTDTFTDRTFPLRPAYYVDLPDDERKRALDACGQANVPDGSLREACALDVVELGAHVAVGFARIPKPRATAILTEGANAGGSEDDMDAIERGSDVGLRQRLAMAADAASLGLAALAMTAFFVFLSCRLLVCTVGGARVLGATHAVGS